MLPQKFVICQQVPFLLQEVPFFEADEQRMLFTHFIIVTWWFSHLYLFSFCFALVCKEIEHLSGFTPRAAVSGLRCFSRALLLTLSVLFQLRSAIFCRQSIVMECLNEAPPSRVRRDLFTQLLILWFYTPNRRRVEAPLPLPHNQISTITNHHLHQ